MQNIIIELGGKSRRLRYDYNAVADMEALAGVGFNTIMDEERAGLNTLRLLMWGGLKHEERGLTLGKVGDMLNEFMKDSGDVLDLMSKAMEALELAGIWGQATEGNAKTETAK